MLRYAWLKASASQSVENSVKLKFHRSLLKGLGVALKAFLGFLMLNQYHHVALKETGIVLGDFEEQESPKLHDP